jgi:hypothetical protein
MMEIAPHVAVDREVHLRRPKNSAVAATARVSVLLLLLLLPSWCDSSSVCLFFKEEFREKILQKEEEIKREI